MNDSWTPDILGADFSSRSIPLGPDPDGESGPLTATVVRYNPSAKDPRRHAVLLINGMSDYFFHTHVAEAFSAEGFAVYAIDLRKTGRSRRAGQRWHYATDFHFYAEELDRAAHMITSVHPTVTPIAHSTGGLIAALWLDHLRRSRPVLHRAVPCAIFNAPWLDIMGKKLTVTVGRPWVSFLGRLHPTKVYKGGNLGVYGRTLHHSQDGSWDFDLDWKPLNGHEKTYGWLRAVIKAQHLVHSGSIDIGVPGLVLCSAASRLDQEYSEDSHAVDTVLDVRQIRRWAPALGRNIRVASIPGAKHDVFLSQEPALSEALERSSVWLKTCLPSTSIS